MARLKIILNVSLIVIYGDDFRNPKEYIQLPWLTIVTSYHLRYVFVLVIMIRQTESGETREYFSKIQKQNPSFH